MRFLNSVDLIQFCFVWAYLLFCSFFAAHMSGPCEINLALSRSTVVLNLELNKSAKNPSSCGEQWK
ncbi:unnamed protein product [Coffea canephora]|uniref:Uncharacterized protein n=1 Tax=Coffea canephora TaxID=49390 RepID=A0A068V142_COFCA|nr:unnamed protein product [Coffea canephora]